VKRNCVRATERAEQARSVNRESMNKNRIEGAAEQGEWASNHEALVTKARRRRGRNSAMLLNSVLPVAYFGPLGVPRLS
jgi:hypothetical protein